MRIVKEENPVIVSQKFEMDCEMTLRIRQRRGRTFESAVIKGGKCLYSQNRILSKLLYYYNSKQKQFVNNEEDSFIFFFSNSPPFSKSCLFSFQIRSYSNFPFAAFSLIRQAECPLNIRYHFGQAIQFSRYKKFLKGKRNLY